jgi:hypothetical protein
VPDIKIPKGGAFLLNDDDLFGVNSLIAAAAGTTGVLCGCKDCEDGTCTAGTTCAHASCTCYCCKLYNADKFTFSTTNAEGTAADIGLITKTITPDPDNFRQYDVNLNFTPQSATYGLSTGKGIPILKPLPPVVVNEDTNTANVSNGNRKSIIATVSANTHSSNAIASLDFNVVYLGGNYTGFIYVSQLGTTSYLQRPKQYTDFWNFKSSTHNHTSDPAILNSNGKYSNAWCLDNNNKPNNGPDLRTQTAGNPEETGGQIRISGEGGETATFSVDIYPGDVTVNDDGTYSFEVRYWKNSTPQPDNKQTGKNEETDYTATITFTPGAVIGGYDFIVSNPNDPA